MEKTFEQKIKELEEISTNLEKGNLSLEDSIKEYEKAVSISKECTKELESAEKKINILSGEKEEEFIQEGE